MQPAVLFNKKLAGNWQILSDEMKKIKWRVRFIEATPGTPGDITFPKPNITFVCFSHEQWDHVNSENEKITLIENLINRIQRSKQRYVKVFLLMQLDSSNIQMLYEIQARLLLECITVDVLPFHNPQEAITLIDIIATGLFPDNQPSIAQRLNMEQRNNINDPTKLASTNKWVHLITQISGSRKLHLHDCYVLQEGLHNIYNIATATLPQLLDCSLDRETAQDVIAFFEADYVID
ncbi:hypothetical protein RclHR1_06740012 [Rhizophagus clarus]|uniref:Uncharacterized protein n=1 Tax=Rhizophagus clarus TaxID=94130 RepID=A0A2Z6RTH9_9GLOM|nr:hypothetical protein RclHR1_06740012 [Rhizophagus clarus]GET01020.1 hypothetical protein GLOIN_2v1841887 [Rhizophagus clarus]